MFAAFKSGPDSRYTCTLVPFNMPISYIFFWFQIPLGILVKDENITEQMIDIIAHLQQYVPKTDSDKMIPILRR